MKSKRVPRTNDLYFRNNGRIYLRLYSASAGEIWRSLGDTKVTQRVRDLADYLRREFYGTDDESLFEKTYAQVADECFAVRMAGNRDSTRAEAERIYAQLKAAFGHKNIKDVRDTDWIGQVQVWRQTTARKKFSHIRVYAQQIDRYAFSQGYKGFRCEFPIDDDPPQKRREITDTQFAILLSTAQTKLYRKKERAFTSLALVLWRWMGLRKMEALELEINRVDLSRRVMHFGAGNVKTGSRTGKGRSIAIPERVVPYLKTALAHSTNEFVFTGRFGRGHQHDLRDSIASLIELTSIKFSPQDLRFAFGTQKVLIEKRPITDVAKYMGNSVAVIEDRYLGHRPEHTRYLVDSDNFQTPPLQGVEIVAV
jgi:integrase